jgi:hypothetical protein
MHEKQERPFKPHDGDSYDLAVSLRQRLADAVRAQHTSVTSQLQSAARERLGSGRATGDRDRLRLRSRRRIDNA